jgi:acyl-CoA synthetase (AMP-forming)/AMP-acid ligase II
MTSLWETVANRGASGRGAFHAPTAAVELLRLANGSCLGGRLASLRGRSILLTMREQIGTALALLELDGVARRLVLCTPDLTPETLAEVAHTAGTGVQLADLDPVPVAADIDRQATTDTEWILLTSGTTGAPKLVAHTLSSLAGALPRQPPGTSVVWSTFYDIRRYGGLQIYLRAVLGGAPLVLSSPAESTADFLLRAGALGVTHISGTPSHWRRALMSGAAGALRPEYVRLSGEVADQGLLDQLQDVYPNARIAHAFASTEAGVAFDVNDGLAGFPADYLETPRDGIELKVEDGTLRIRSHRTAARLLGSATAPLCGDDGFVDTGDLVELKEGRYYFRGRRGGVINVGGLKVYPEEVEGVLNADPRVRMSLVRPKKSPITGAIVVAEVVLEDSAGASLDAAATEHIKTELLEACRRALPAHKVPARLSFVPSLTLSAAGKLVRPQEFA